MVNSGADPTVNHSYRKTHTSKSVSSSSSKITTHIFRYFTDEIITDSQIAPVCTVARVRYLYTRILDTGDSPGAVEALWRWPEACQEPLSWKFISTHLRLLVSLTSQDQISKNAWSLYTPSRPVWIVAPFLEVFRIGQRRSVSLLPRSQDSLGVVPPRWPPRFSLGYSFGL